MLFCSILRHHAELTTEDAQSGHSWRERVRQQAIIEAFEASYTITVEKKFVSAHSHTKTVVTNVIPLLILRYRVQRMV